ncbi:unnamed protein product [Rhizophagus irregularis]|nr:unnamed protein product [Rhizophagus irregularis]
MEETLMLVPIDSNEKHTLTLPQRDEHRFSNIDEIKNNMYELLITPLAPSTVPAKRLSSDIEREGRSKKRSKKKKKQKKREF